MANMRKAHSHVLRERRDEGNIGGVEQIEREFTDVVHTCNQKTILFFRKRVDQYLMDCSAAIDRVERRKDANMVGIWGKVLALQHNDDRKKYSIIVVQLFEGFQDMSRTARHVYSKYLQFSLTLNDLRNVENVVTVKSLQSKMTLTVSPAGPLVLRRSKFYQLTLRSCPSPSSVVRHLDAILSESQRESAC